MVWAIVFSGKGILLTVAGCGFPGRLAISENDKGFFIASFFASLAPTTFHSSGEDAPEILDLELTVFVGDLVETVFVGDLFPLLLICNGHVKDSDILIK